MNVKGFGDQVLKKFEASTTGRMSVRVPGVALAKHREAQVLSASVWEVSWCTDAPDVHS